VASFMSLNPVAGQDLDFVTVVFYEEANITTSCKPLSGNLSESTLLIIVNSSSSEVSRKGAAAYEPRWGRTTGRPEPLPGRTDLIDIPFTLRP